MLVSASRRNELLNGTLADWTSLDGDSQRKFAKAGRLRQHPGRVRSPELSCRAAGVVAGGFGGRRISLDNGPHYMALSRACKMGGSGGGFSAECREIVVSIYIRLAVWNKGDAG